MKFATDIDCLITEALERIATNTRTAVVALDAIYTDCKEEYYLWDSTERPCGKGVTCLTYSQVTTPHSARTPTLIILNLPGGMRANTPWTPGPWRPRGGYHLSLIHI